MGVNGLWELLAPVGRRVSVETVSGKKLAIDASIWMIQFMKAMRDEIGEMAKNAHLLGFFRRICKLLFLRTKPVFVFDGGTPVLKRRTVIARRRQRENAQVKLRKTAEKLLLNRFKEIKLMELAKGAGNPSPNKNANCKNFPPDESSYGDIPTSAKSVSVTPAHQNIDELLAKSLAAEATGAFLGTLPSNAGMLSLSDEDGDVEDDNEEMILPAAHGKIDASVLAALPPSMQLDLLVQMRERLMAENRQKYQHVKTAPSDFSELQIESYLKMVAFRREIDDAQKAADVGRGVGGVRASRIASETNREFIFSSSFSGDKSKLIHAEHRSPARPIVPQMIGESSSTDNADATSGTDERGRTRVRPSGVRITLDLERTPSPLRGIPAGDGAELEAASESCRPHDGAGNPDPPPVADGGISIELTLGKVDDDGDDDVFARLAGESGEESEFSWEEEEGDEQIPAAVSRGVLEEDADVQEAIRRSLEDVRPPEVVDHDEGAFSDAEGAAVSSEALEEDAEAVSTSLQEDVRSPGAVDAKHQADDDVEGEQAGFSLEDVRWERAHLVDEQRKMERNAETASSEMFAECRELLRMFGLPYVVAPMEAEAQCAHLELNGLVDAVVTDDSDVFLFGGRSVYKNIFDERRYVETYLMEDVEAELGLSREKLIRMALLLGSDYTEGVSGIGIVNAVEVIGAFPDEEDGLARFRQWVESPDPSIVPTTSAAAPAADAEQLFMEKHRKVSKNWHIPLTFPSDAVMSAYASPQVDKSVEPFSWGKPDLSVLRRLCIDKFGWTRQKSDDVLLPVLKEYNTRQTQLRMDAFYTFNERFAKIRSVRMKKAVKGIIIKEGAGRRKRVRPNDDDSSIPKKEHKVRRS